MKRNLMSRCPGLAYRRANRPAFPRDVRLPLEAAALYEACGDDVRAERPAELSAGLLACFFALPYRKTAINTIVYARVGAVSAAMH